MTYMGASRAAIGLVAVCSHAFSHCDTLLTIVQGDIYSLMVYTPVDGTEEYWGKDVPRSVLIKAMGSCLPMFVLARPYCTLLADALRRLTQLVGLSTSIRCLPITELPEFESWVHPDGRVVLVGDAAHPFPVSLFHRPRRRLPLTLQNQRGSTHGYAASVCDAASLGELFRHLHSDGQIDSFLLAYENIRRDRVKLLLQVDIASPLVISMPEGEQKTQRDMGMKEKYAAGLDAFAADESDVAAHWEVRFTGHAFNHWRR